MIELGGDKKASGDRRNGPSFSGIVGQEELKQALLAVCANADLNGLLIRGEKGTAKSTAVRGLAGLLPEQTVVADCPFGCPPDDPDRQCADCRERADPPTAERPVPLVTLPLGATRERVVGSLSVADALSGDHEFDPGLLARANRGILYVDEVNLLDDHLVDVVLDAAAGGVNVVERDGVSVRHPAEFTLVGTMNPEEGDLRPQLRDRFALSATVTACDDIDRRVAIIDRAIASDDGTRERAPESAESAGPGARLRAARDRLDEVELPGAFAEEIAELCRDAGVDGHRGDIATARAAVTVAALDGRETVIESDVRRAADLALSHRLQSRPFEDAPDPEEFLDDHFEDGEPDDAEDGDEGSDRDQPEAGEASDESEGERAKGGEDESATNDTDPEQDGPDPTPSEPSGPDDEDGAADHEGGAADGETENGPPAGGEVNAEPTMEAGEAESRPVEDDERTEGTPVVPGQSRPEVGEANGPELAPPDAIEGGEGSGTRSRSTPSVDTEGASVRTERADGTHGIDAAASVRAASARGGSSVESRDLRQSVRRSDGAALVVFVVDASASMRPAMRAAKGTVLELLKDAYRGRDEVAFVTFAGEGANVLLPPTESVTLAARHLKNLPTGDRTPLPAGLRAAGEVLERADPSASVVVLVTDGRANVANGSPVDRTREAAKQVGQVGDHVVVVDAGDDGAGLAGLVAEETGGDCVPLSALSADRVDAAVGAARENEV